MGRRRDPRRRGRGGRGKRQCSARPGAAGRSDVIAIASAQPPDGTAACLLSWGGEDWLAPLEDVRRTALDMVVCADLADLMMMLVTDVGLDQMTVGRVAGDLMLARHGRRKYGSPSTVTLLPAGSTEWGTGIVLISRKNRRGSVTALAARTMALHWLRVAEISETDQLVAESLRTTGIAGDEEIERLFGYLRMVRGRAAPPSSRGLAGARERLVTALEECGDPKLADIIAKARQGVYDEFTSPLAAPLAALVEDLRAVGRHDLVERVVAGEFDATEEEAKAWLASEEGQETIRTIVRVEGGGYGPEEGAGPHTPA